MLDDQCCLLILMLKLTSVDIDVDLMIDVLQEMASTLCVARHSWMNENE